MQNIRKEICVSLHNLWTADVDLHPASQRVQRLISAYAKASSCARGFGVTRRRGKEDSQAGAGRDIRLSILDFCFFRRMPAAVQRHTRQRDSDLVWRNFVSCDVRQASYKLARRGMAIPNPRREARPGDRPAQPGDDTDY